MYIAGITRDLSQNGIINTPDATLKRGSRENNSVMACFSGYENCVLLRFGFYGTSTQDQLYCTSTCHAVGAMSNFISISLEMWK